MGQHPRVSGLVMDVRQGDVLLLGPDVKLHVLEKSGRIMRLRIAAPLDMKISKAASRPLAPERPQPA